MARVRLRVGGPTAKHGRTIVARVRQGDRIPPDPVRPLLNRIFDSSL